MEDSSKRLLRGFLIVVGALALIVFLSIVNSDSSKDSNSVVSFECDAEAEKENPNVGVVDIDGYRCLLENKKPFAIVLAQTTCSHCIEYKPYASEAAATAKKPIYVINVDTLTEDDFNTLNATISYFEDEAHESWGTPLTVFMNSDGEMTDYIEGYTDDVDSIVSKLSAQ